MRLWRSCSWRVRRDRLSLGGCRLREARLGIGRLCFNLKLVQCSDTRRDRWGQERSTH